MTLGHFGTGSRALPPTQRPRPPRVVRPAPYPPPKRRRNLLVLLSGGDPTLATSPYTSCKCRPDRASVRCEEVLLGQAGLAQPLSSTYSQREATVTTRLFEEGTTLSSSSRFETSALRRPPACRAAPTSGSETAREQVRIEVPRASSPAATTFPQLSLSATVSIRLRATEIRRCQAPWRRPPQSPSRGCLRGLWPPAWRPLDGWRRRRGHHG